MSMKYTLENGDELSVDGPKPGDHRVTIKLADGVKRSMSVSMDANTTAMLIRVLQVEFAKIADINR